MNRNLSAVKNKKNPPFYQTKTKNCNIFKSNKRNIIDLMQII